MQSIYGPTVHLGPSIDNRFSASYQKLSLSYPEFSILRPECLVVRRVRSAQRMLLTTVSPVVRIKLRFS